MAVGRSRRPHADGDPDRHRQRAAHHGTGSRQFHPRGQPRVRRHRRSRAPAVPGRRSRAAPITDVRAHAARRRAAGGATRADGASPARARSRSTEGSRPAASTTSSTGRAIRASSGSGSPGRAIWSASSSTRPPPTATRCPVSASPSAGACRRPADSSATSSTRASTRTSAGRIVFDGVFDQVGGAGRGSFNHRFGQQSRDQLQHFNIQYPVDMFPFTDDEQTDPVTGARRRAARRGRGAATPCRSSSTCSPTRSTSTAPARWCTPT